MLLDLLMSRSESPQSISTESAHVSRLYKTLLQGGHYNQATKTVDVCPYFDPLAFAQAFVMAANKEDVIQMTVTGGAFVTIELVQALRKGGDGLAELDTLQSWLDEAARSRIQKSDTKGRDLLLQNIALLDTKGS